MSELERELLLALAEAVSELSVEIAEHFFPAPVGCPNDVLERIGELSARIWRLRRASE